MGYEDESSYEDQKPMSVNYQSNPRGNINLGIPQHHFLFAPHNPTSWQQENKPLPSPSPPPMSEDPTVKESVDISDFPNPIKQNLESSKQEETPVKSADIGAIFANMFSPDPPNEDPTLYEEKVSFNDLQEGVDYVVMKKGDTLSAIALARKGIDLDKIKQLNPTAAANSARLPIGTRILINGATSNIGKRINSVGYIQGIEGQDVTLKENASQDTEISTIKYGSKVYIEKTDVSNSWYYVTVDGQKGWIEKHLINTNIPLSDPNAELYYVSDFEVLEGILKQKYQADQETSYWHYGRATSLLNPKAFIFDGGAAQQFMQEQGSSAKGISKLFIDEEIGLQLLYNSLKIKAGYHIWLPSVEYVDRAKASGTIESRSELIQGVINLAEGVESFIQGAWNGFNNRIEEEISNALGALDGLSDFVQDIIGNIHGIIMDVWEYIKQFSIQGFLQELLDGLIDPTLKMAINKALENISHPNIEFICDLWGAVVGIAVALGAIYLISQNFSAILNVLKKVSPRLGDIFNSKQLELASPNGKNTKVKGNDDRPQNMRMDGDKDGVGGNETPEEKRKRLQEKKRKIEDEKIKQKIENIKKQSFAQRKQELGTDPAKKYIEHEGEVGAKIEKEFGYLERSPNTDVEWISLSGQNKGKTLDLIGLEPGISAKVPNDMKRFLISLKQHFIKADIVVLDYRYMNKEQIESVERFLREKGIKDGSNLKKIWKDSDLGK